MSEILHIVTCIANPIGWKSRLDLARAAIADWLHEPNVHVTLVECAYGSRGHDLTDLAGPRVTHVPVRATTLVWNKENLLNIGISRLPESAKKIATLDADIQFRRAGWATATLRALDLYPVVQPWDKAYDLGPNDEHIQTHVSFASLFHAGKPVVPDGSKWWKFDGGPYDYAHSGYAWAYVRSALDKIGGLFEVGGMGSGDHHMALAIAGYADKSMPADTNGNYRSAVTRWEARALAHINQKLGFVHGTIEHLFHGSKAKRGYLSRWGMFIDHAFDPHEDLKRNTYGVLEFSGAKPALERQFDQYLRSRSEDSNSLD
ncbi:hypothetical protein [Methylovirgula sp. 4M-Z18]|uniref:hypothetical protein n=1 Tax=Methylovirgula sp. 4M-Z18 TaxID=2293567 RepID=UPI000E2E68BC|nr:hypothetical protein [Methylovirgula sp. 4M-Z18]RFB80387.1 hypothetical protein DYH55_02345 [Methylovirgula sp. 4M-Z18]